MWKTGITNGHWWEAKVYDVGSIFGINGGRVSKLCIAMGKTSNTEFIYSYDRGLDFNEAPKELLDAVIKDATK